jgi:hypothetical protein
MIDLYGMASPNVEKILIMLEEARLDYRLHQVDVFAGEQFAPDFLRLNPNSKVPVIIDDTGRRPSLYDIRVRRNSGVSGQEKRPPHANRPRSSIHDAAVADVASLRQQPRPQHECPRTGMPTHRCVSRGADARSTSLRVTPDGGLRRSETATCPSATHARRGRRCEHAATRLRANPVRARGV